MARNDRRSQNMAKAKREENAKRPPKDNSPRPAKKQSGQAMVPAAQAARVAPSRRGPFSAGRNSGSSLPLQSEGFWSDIS